MEDTANILDLDKIIKNLFTSPTNINMGLTDILIPQLADKYFYETDQKDYSNYIKLIWRKLERYKPLFLVTSTTFYHHDKFNRIRYIKMQYLPAIIVAKCVEAALTVEKQYFIQSSHARCLLHNDIIHEN